MNALRLKLSRRASVLCALGVLALAKKHGCAAGEPAYTKALGLGVAEYDFVRGRYPERSSGAPLTLRPVDRHAPPPIAWHTGPRSYAVAHHMGPHQQSQHMRGTALRAVFVPLHIDPAANPAGRARRVGRLHFNTTIDLHRSPRTCSSGKKGLLFDTQPPAAWCGHPGPAGSITLLLPAEMESNSFGRYRGLSVLNFRQQGPLQAREYTARRSATRLSS